MEFWDLSNYNANFSNPFFLVGVFNAISAITAGLIVFLKNTKDRRNLSFFLFTLIVFVWAVLFSISQFAREESVALFWIRARMSALIFLPFFVLHFVIQFVKEKSKNLTTVTLLFSLIAIVFFFLNFTSLFIEGVAKGASFTYWPIGGPTYRIYLALWICGLLYSVYILSKTYINAQGIDKQQIKYVLIGFIISLFAGMSNLFGKYGFSFAPLLSMLTSAYVVLIAYSILKYSLFEIKYSFAADTIINTVADLIFVVDKNMRIVIVNSVAIKTLGIRKNKIINQPINKFLSGRDILRMSWHIMTNP